MADYNFLARGIGPSLVEGSHAAYYGEKSREAVDEAQGTKTAAPYLADALAGDPNAIRQVAMSAPHFLQHIAPRLAALDAAKQAHLEKVSNWAGDTSGAILDAPEAEQAGLYASALKQAQAQGIPGVETWPQQWGPDAKNFATIQRAHAKNIREWIAAKKAPKAAGGAPAGDGMEPMASATPPGVSPEGTMVADAAPPVAAPVVAQAAPPPGPSGPPMIADAGPPPLGGAAPPNAGGLGAGEPPEAPPVQMAQAAPPAAPPGIGPGLAPPAAALQSPKPEGLPPRPEGIHWTVDPALYGGVPQGGRATPKSPLLPLHTNGEFVYKLPPDAAHPAGQVVMYKPQPAADKFKDEFGPDGKTLIGQRGPDNKFYPVNQRAQAAGIPPELADVHGEQFIATRPPEEANLIRSIIGLKPGFQPADLSKRGDYNHLMGLVLQADPDYDPTTSGQRRKFEMNNLVNGDEAKTLSAANTAISHAKIFRDLTEAMQNGDTRLINTIVNEAKKQFGDANVPSAEIARDLYGEELVKAVKGSGQLNEAQEQQMRKNLSINAGPKATQGVIDTLTNLMEGKVHVVEDTARKFGVPESRIKEYITPRSREALDYIKGNPLGAPKAPAAAAADDPRYDYRVNPQTGARERKLKQ